MSAYDTYIRSSNRDFWDYVESPSGYETKSTCNDPLLTGLLEGLYFFFKTRTQSIFLYLKVIPGLQIHPEPV